MNSTLDLELLRQWIGRTESRSDVVTPQLVAGFRATILDESGSGDRGGDAPAGIHWCLAAATAPMSGIGEDGHPERGGFLPPVPLPRRMWAGSRTSFGDALRMGDTVERQSTIKSVAAKTGSTGPLCFVTVEHVYGTDRGEAIREEQDLVYRDAGGSGNPPTIEATGEAIRPDRTRSIAPSPVLLFRYSALTFNGHRIHYDRPYATEVEGYGGLVVHGPLQATLLLHLATGMRDGKMPRSFQFRAKRPLLDTDKLVMSGKWRSDTEVDLWTGPNAGAPFVSAGASW